MFWWFFLADSLFQYSQCDSVMSRRISNTYLSKQTISGYCHFVIGRIIAPFKLTQYCIERDICKGGNCDPSHNMDPLSRHRISIIKIRPSWERLIFILGIHALVRQHLYTETGPWNRLWTRKRQIPNSHDDVIKWKHFPRHWSFV